MYQIHYRVENSGLQRKYWIREDGQYHTASGTVVEKIEKTENSSVETTYNILPVSNGTTSNLDIEFDIIQLIVVADAYHGITVLTDTTETRSITVKTTIAFVPYVADQSILDQQDVPKVLHNLGIWWQPRDP